MEQEAPPTPQDLAALLAYWQECGVRDLVGETSPLDEPQWDLLAHRPAPRATKPPIPAQPRKAPKAPPVVKAKAPVRFEPPEIDASGSTSEQLGRLREMVAGCDRCQLLVQSRTQTVFGVGSPTASVIFVGEAPGADEDRQGEPFVGAAGKLLDRMIRATGHERAEVYIANVLKCRPPGNRNPLPPEVAACRGYLEKQLELIAPKALFALGKFAIQFLLGGDKPISTYRGRLHQWRGIPVIASYHPAYYLRQPWQKRAGWQDLQQLLKLLKET